MDVSFEQLKSMVVFAAIVEQGSFSAASKTLKISRASVSYHIKKLEEQLGVNLFYRSTRSVSLTDAGTRYYQRCRVVVEQAHGAQRDIERFKQEPEGNLKITCPIGVGAALITPIVSEFKQLYPKIHVELMLTDAVVNLIAEGIDIGIRGAAKQLADSDLQSVKLTAHTMCLCASPQYLNKFGRPASPNDLEKHQWVIYTSSAQTFAMTQGSKSHSITMQGTLTTDHAPTRTQFVVDGHGLGKLPLYGAAAHIENGQLERLLADYEMPSVDMFAVFPAGAASQRKLRLFLDHIKQRFSQLSERSLI